MHFEQTAGSDSASAGLLGLFSAVGDRQVARHFD